MPTDVVCIPGSFADRALQLRVSASEQLLQLLAIAVQCVSAGRQQVWLRHGTVRGLNAPPADTFTERKEEQMLCCTCQ
jgi:hypothetical protein